ncbi:MAG: hypothetical protein IJK28_00615 [Clostridia bacterium]|nr:hypothetical protein [Clostridia bacterium]
MRQTRTLGQYRAIDLGIWAVLLLVFETILFKAGTVWFPAEAYMVSLSAVITAVVMMRWGAWALIHALLAGALDAWLLRSSGSAVHWAVYPAGGLLCVTGLLIRRLWGPEGIRTSWLKTLVFGGVILLSMQAGRALTALLLGYEAASALHFITEDVVTLLFTLAVLWVVRRLDGVFEDQRLYLKRVRRETEQEEAEGKGGFQ